MPNGFIKLLWLTIALTAVFAVEYFGIRWPWIIAAFSLYRFLIIDIIECSVTGTLAALDHYTHEQAEIDFADERDFADEYRSEEDTILSSDTFAKRVARHEED